MYYGFTGLCEEFTRTNEGYFVVPVRITGSSIESVFSRLKYISGGNLSSANYSSSLSALVTQRETSANPNAEVGYRTLETVLH